MITLDSGLLFWPALYTMEEKAW